MDLNRAKTILIAAFLILNCYLGYQVWQKSEAFMSYQTVSAGEVAEVVGKLEANNYRTAVSPSRQISTMSLLSVQALDLEEERIVAALFPGEETPQLRIQDDQTSYTLRGETLTFPGKGRVSYRKPIIQAPPLQESRDLRRRGEEYLKSKGLMPEDARFTIVAPGDGDTQVVTFHQIYQGVSLYSSHIKLYYLGGELTGFDLYWLEPLAFSSDSRYVIPSTQALLRFLEIRGTAPEPVEINAMTLGYFSREYDAQRWDVVPVWRIADSSGNALHINAFSGEEEKN